ncbi:MAG: MBL fold metallo-hydrolase, partial [Myxococcota bacterium]
MSSKSLNVLALALLTIPVGSCVDPNEGFDPNQPPPGDLLDIAIPPRRCSFEQLAIDPMDLQVHVIDVGQGDSLLIRTPDDGVPGNGTAEGLTILIDAGDSGELSTTNAAPIIDNWLEPLGITRIDYAFVTHAHADHFGGMFGMFDRVDVVNVVDPGYDRPITRYREFLAAAEVETAANGGQVLRPIVPALVPEVGGELMWGDELTVRLLSARDTADLGERDNAQVNNTSIVLHIEYNGTRILLTGDAEEELEAALVESGFDLAAEILKAGHHGSSTSSTNAFLSAVWPDSIPRDRRLALVSSGRREFSGTQL